MGWRFAHPAPPLPAGTPGWEELGSKVVQTLFCVLMIGLPLTGLLALPRRITQHPEISGISLFGLFPIPRLDLAIGLPWGGLHSIGRQHRHCPSRAPRRGGPQASVLGRRRGAHEDASAPIDTGSGFR